MVFIKDPSKSKLGSIQCSYDAAISVPSRLETALAAEKEGYQVLIISCGGDPGLAPLREIVKVPVVPPGNTAKHICSMLGERFSVLTTGKKETYRTEIYEREGLLKWISTHPIGYSVPEVRIKKDEVFDAMVIEGKKVVKEFRAAAITFGCMSMGFNMVDEALSSEIEVPVVNPVKSAVKVAELLIDLKLSHSKNAYPFLPNFI
jgi:allantoin racemase